MTVASTENRDHRDHRGLIVIGHRGASGYRPEHTLESYRLAIRMGADFIEPDLVATGDGVLVARHENEISATTDVASRAEFAHRKVTKTVDGAARTGWFTEDFSLAELKTLRARERIPEVRPANGRFDGMYQIPTLAEIVRLAERESRDGRVIGIYPETKHPTYFAREGRRIDGSPIAISLGARLVDTLRAERFTDPRRVYIQSFEVENLLELHDRLLPDAGLRLPLIQLYGDLDTARPYDMVHNAARGVDLSAVYGGLDGVVADGITGDTRYGALATEPVLAWMAAHYARGIGPWKDNLLPRAAPAPGREPATDCGAESGHCERGVAHPVLARALRLGLQVHPYTLRADEALLRGTAESFPSALDQAVQLYGLGVQGFFIDQPDVGVAARAIFLDRQHARRGGQGGGFTGT